MEDHLVNPQTLKRRDPGKVFKSTELPLPIAVRRAIVNMKLGHVKKAGTASNQRASAASAWLANHVSSNFASATMAWTGKVSKCSPQNGAFD